MLDTDILQTTSASQTSNHALKSALRERLKSNILYKLPSCRFNEEETNEKDDVVIITDVIEQSDNDSDNIDLKITVPLVQRRLRNRLAARKCREKRKQRITSLEKICMELEGQAYILNTEIKSLDEQKRSLTKLMSKHHCVRKIQRDLT